MLPLVEVGRLLVQVKECIHRDLRASHRILHRKDDIIRDLDELADEREIPRAARDRAWAISEPARHEHARDVGHSAGNAVGRLNGLQIES